MKLDITKLKTDPKQPRKTFEEIEGMAETLKKEGMITPILVDRDYRIINGERRYRAALKLGWKQVPVTVADVKNDQKRLIWQCIEDIQHKDFPIHERDQAWLKLWKMMKKPSNTQMAEILGVDSSTFGDAIARAEYVPTLDPSSLPSPAAITFTRSLPPGIRERTLEKIQKEGIRNNAEVNAFITKLKQASPSEQEQILATPRTDWSAIGDRVRASAQTVTRYLTPELLTHLPKIEVILLTGSLTELKRKLETYNAQKGEIVE